MLSRSLLEAKVFVAVVVFVVDAKIDQLFNAVAAAVAAAAADENLGKKSFEIKQDLISAMDVRAKPANR